MQSKNKDSPLPTGDRLLPSVADLGALIRQRREALGMSLRAVAEATGLSLAFVHAVEHGKETAEIGKVLLLANALGIDLLGRLR